MGVLKKNETKNEDMAAICKFLHQYVPGHDESSDYVPMKTLSGGDYLTFERHKQAQMSVRDDETPSLRLEGLVAKMEEFHNQAELLKVKFNINVVFSRFKVSCILHAHCIIKFAFFVYSKLSQFDF